MRVGRMAAVAGLAVVFGSGSAMALPLPTVKPTVVVPVAGMRFLEGENSLTEQAGVAVPWPLELRIAKGTSLLLVNLDPSPHSLTSDTCADGEGFEDPKAPPPLTPIADAVDDDIAPTVFGDHELPSPSDVCLFDSRAGAPNNLTAQGDPMPVDTASLPIGNYGFHCVVHDFMQGTLHVVNND